MKMMDNRELAKRLWNVLRVTFFMIRKGLVSKRKLIMDMNLFMKKGKLLRKSLSNLITSISSSHHHHNHSSRGSFGLQEYEFSCSNSPNPVFFHVSNKRNKHHHHHHHHNHHNYFPCINHPLVIEEEDEQEVYTAVALLPKTPEYNLDERVITNGMSPFHVRVSNYSSEEEENENENVNVRVDDDAEEFIQRFYEQLRAQRHMHLLQYHQQMD